MVHNPYLPLHPWPFGPWAAVRSQQQPYGELKHSGIVCEAALISITIKTITLLAYVVSF